MPHRLLFSTARVMCGGEAAASNVHGARTGNNCYCPRSIANKNSVRKWCFAPMLPLPSRRFTRRWRNAA